MGKRIIKQCLCLLVLISFEINAKEYLIVLKDHLFYPSKITIPENQKVKLIIENQDDTPEEFDSFDLNREKVLYPHRKSVIYIGPLKRGRYAFFGEFSPNSATGVVIVHNKEAQHANN
jgi:hypothetical protein